MLFTRLTGIAIVLLLCSTPLRATHYLGGELTYTALGNNQYRIVVRIYRDCRHGEPAAITDDLPIRVSIFNGSGGSLVQQLELSTITIQNIQPTTLPGCVQDEQAACVQLCRSITGCNAAGQRGRLHHRK